MPQIPILKLETCLNQCKLSCSNPLSS